MATSLLVAPFTSVSQLTDTRQQRKRKKEHYPQVISLKCHPASSLSKFSCLSYSFITSHINDNGRQWDNRCVTACLDSSTSHSAPPTSTKLYISGLSFRTTEESLRNAFEKFGQLVEVNLVMDRIANRPRGFAFISYATGDESKKAIEGMHGKFLDGRVIFVEVAKPRSEVSKNKQNFREPPN